MVLCIDIENTYTELGVFDGGKLKANSTFSTVKDNSSDEYALSIKNMLELNGIGMQDIDGAVISSVVATITTKVYEGVKKLCKIEPIVLAQGVKTSLDIKLDNPSELGGDIIANCVGAIDKYGAPTIVFDLATATTISVINDKKQLCDVYIVPGIRSSSEAMSDSAQGLPGVQISLPKTMSGKNTQSSMRCGVMYSSAFVIDGFADKIKEQYGTDFTLVASGEYAPDIIRLCQNKLTYDKHLTLMGLLKIYEKNA